MAVRLLACLILIADIAAAQAIPDREIAKDEARGRYFDRVEKDRIEKKKNAKAEFEREIAVLQRSLTLAKRGIVDPSAPGILTYANGDGPTTYPSAESKRQAVEQNAKLLDEARKNLAAAKSGKYEPPRASFPLLPSEPIGSTGVPWGSYRVADIVDDRNAILTNERYFFWVSGISTRDWTDDKTVSIKDVMWISGKKTYDITNGGTKTVPLLEFLSP